METGVISSLTHDGNGLGGQGVSLGSVPESHMHEENASDEADALTVAHFFVQQTVGLQQVEQLQLPRAQRLGKVRVARESATCTHRTALVSQTTQHKQSATCAQ